MSRIGQWFSIPAMVACCVLLSCERDETPIAAEPSQLPSSEKQEPLHTEDFSAVRAYEHCAALCALGPRPTGSDAYRKQVEMINSQLTAIGWHVQSIIFSPPSLPRQRMQNLCATFGEANTPRELVLSCHIDTKGSGENAILGADDGASGAAVLLELARVLTLQPDLARRIELVFFDGEESFGPHITPQDGLFGSRHEVQRRIGCLPRYLINLDMVGGAGKTIAVPLLDTTEDMMEQYLNALHTLGLPETRWTILPGSMLDDHRPFAEAGVHTLNLIASFCRSTWWHTKADNMDRISHESLGETGRMVLQLLRQIL